VFQFAILSFCVNVIQVPYNAVLIVHEKMSVYIPNSGKVIIKYTKEILLGLVRTGRVDNENLLPGTIGINA
jgi:hypothetical protein